MHTKPEDHPAAYLPAMGHDRLIGLYDPFVRLLGVQSLHRALLDRADIRPGHRILEIGCGTGNLALLVKRLHPTADVVGIDPDPKARARAQRKARRAALSVRLDRGYAEALPYADASFDRVLSALMFHHLTPEVQVAALNEVRRVLAPGGTLQLLDIAGAERPSGWLFSRLHHRHVDRLPALLHAAGFVQVTATLGGKVLLAGTVLTYSATAPTPHTEKVDAVY